MPRIDADGEHEGSHRRQVRAEGVIKQGKLRNDEGDEEGHHHDQHAHQQGGIHERGDELLAEAYRQALERNVAPEDFLEVAALLARQQGGGVNLGEDTLRLEGFREQFAAAHAIAHVLQHRTEEHIALPLDEQLERLNDGQTGMNEGDKLLVEDDKLVLPYLAPMGQSDVGGEQVFAANRIDEIALLRE